MKVWIRLESLRRNKFVYGRTLRKLGYTRLGVLVDGGIVEVCTIADNAKIPILPSYYVS